MKIIAILVLLLAPTLSFSQDFDKNKEKAYFAVKHQGDAAFTTSIKSMDGDFTKDDLSALQEIMAQKEGIFEISRPEFGYLTISHLSHIDYDTLKYFLLQVKPKFEIVESVAYSF